MTDYYVGPHNAKPLIGIVITLCIVTGVLVIWRISYRGSRGLLGWSDYLLIAGLVLALCQAGFNIGGSTVWGYGYHKLDIPPSVRTSPTPKLLFFLNQVFFKIETGCTKLSISVVYMNIFHHAVTQTVRVSRTINYGLAFVIASYYTAGSLVSFFQCTPVHKAWDSATPGKCIDNDQFRLANGYINIITSAWLIIMPFPALLSVQRRNKELWQFLGLVALGLIHTACAIWRVELMYHPDPLSATDPQWSSTLPNTLAMVEEFIGIIAACIIVMGRCFHNAAKRFSGAITTFMPTMTGRSSTLTPTGRSRAMSGTIVSGKARGGRDGFSIMKTTEIEMESRNKSTENIREGEIQDDRVPMIEV